MSGATAAPDRLVLILDDEASIRESLGEFLMDCRIPVVLAESAEEALAMDCLGDVAVAVVDIRLGGMNGLEFIKVLHRGHPHIQCIIHTGSTDFQLDAELLAIGLTHDEVLFKPLMDMAVLEEAVRRKMAESCP